MARLPTFGRRRNPKPSPGKSPRRRGMRPDIDLNFQMPEINLPKSSNDNAPQTVNRAMGSFARAGRGPGSPTGVMPNFRRESASPVSGRDSVEKILATATQYLASIDASLKAQVQQQQYAYNQGQKQQRENAAESGGGLNLGSSWIGQKAGNLASVAKEEMWHLTKVLGGLGLLYTYLNFDELEQKFGDVVVEAAKENAAGYLAMGGIIGAGLLGGKAAAALKKRKLRKQAADTMLGLYPDEIANYGKDPNATKMGKGARLASLGGKAIRGLRGGLYGVVAGTVLDVLPSILGIDPGGRLNAALNIGSSVAMGAGLGATFFGMPGAIVGGVFGAAKGLYDYGKQLWTGKPSNPDAPNADVPDTAYDVVLGKGRYGYTENYYDGRKLTQLTVAEAIQFGRNVLQPKSKADGVGISAEGELLGDSGMGAYQTNWTTIKSAVDAGVIGMSDVYDATAQDTVAKWLYGTRQGSLHTTWAHFKKTGERSSPLSFEEAKPLIMAGEGTAGQTNNAATIGGGAAVNYTFEQAKSEFGTIGKLINRDDMRLMSIQEGASRSSATQTTKLISEQAKLRETFMRGKERLQKTLIVQENNAAADRYSRSRQSRADFGRVPDPSHYNEKTADSLLYKLAFFHEPTIRMRA